ncbi:thiamine pyrophosphate-binding protein [Thiorhodococcus mannitoliphagus]|uniref:Thiamine pyrophosphate-binding protein n=1 Tax=Thiorhodococcus mannitoliphagus TaxID=329406 RepID=A0A6P1DYB1_9GAMM|nr:thiamine pyrophosphate-binding protein [Thiorhodococcus mannitoliphagus]NEX21706.1 thiamine pyrophosphate-binding protein [Thiorhodococcus mannitoliphagus]
MKLSDYVMGFLAQQGVQHVFFLPGGGAMHLNDSLGRCPGVEFIAVQHEQAAAIAAEAYARVTNKLGVAMVTTGPGGTNAVTGVAAAWLDSTPVLFISGQVKRADLRRDPELRQLGVQEIDIVSIVKPITKYAVTILEPESIRFHLEQALHLAGSARPGPVWIDIPLDVQAAEIDVENLQGYFPVSPETPSHAAELRRLAEKTIQMLNESERPVVLVGNGVRLAGGEALFEQLVESFGVPVLTTRLGVDLLPASHPLCFGMPGGIASRSANFTLQNSDFLLTIGARLDMQLLAYAPKRFARAARKVMVNIDEAEIRRLGDVIDLGIQANAKAFLAQLLALRSEFKPRDRTPWIERCHHWQARYPFVQPEQRRQASRISMYAFSEYLAEQLAEGDVVLPGSSGFAAEIFLTAFKCKRGQRVFHNKGTGSMGLAQPAAIGACLASGRKRTICVDGDGGFAMNIQELETIRRLQLPIKFFVVNNQGYASIRASQNNHFKLLVGADDTSGLTLPDWVTLANAYGIPARQASNPDILPEAIQAILNTSGPAICEIVVLPDEPRIPRVASLIREDGSMTSRPLEDLFPFLDRDELAENMLIPIIEE